ncbi:MAG: hypothetical protein ABIH99_05545 [Candidatus Micrarchaeota archaeon]
MTSSNDEQLYKDNAKAVKNEFKTELSTEVAAAKKELLEIESELLQKFKDPLTLGTLMFKLMQEKENANRILQNINAKLDRLEGRIEKLERVKPPKKPAPNMLPEVDMRIISFVKGRKGVNAEELQKEMRYRGRNAASARLSRLYGIGLLGKKQVGKKVYYFMQQNE